MEREQEPTASSVSASLSLSFLYEQVVASYRRLGKETEGEGENEP